MCQSNQFSTPKNKRMRKYYAYNGSSFCDKDQTNIEILIKGPKHEIPIQ